MRSPAEDSRGSHIQSASQVPELHILPTPPSFSSPPPHSLFLLLWKDLEKSLLCAWNASMLVRTGARGRGGSPTQVQSVHETSQPPTQAEKDWDGAGSAPKLNSSQINKHLRIFPVNLPYIHFILIPAETQKGERRIFPSLQWMDGWIDR